VLENNSKNVVLEEIICIYVHDDYTKWDRLHYIDSSIWVSIIITIIIIIIQISFIVNFINYDGLISINIHCVVCFMFRNLVLEIFYNMDFLLVF